AGGAIPRASGDCAVAGRAKTRERIVTTSKRHMRRRFSSNSRGPRQARGDPRLSPVAGIAAVAKEKRPREEVEENGRRRDGPAVAQLVAEALPEKLASRRGPA